MPAWPAVSPSNLTLFLNKIYLTNEIVDTNNLIEHLDLPIHNIKLICSQLLSNKPSEEEAINLFNSLNLSDINPEDKQQYDFIHETILQFDQILQITLIDVWAAQKNRLLKIIAADKLKAKLTAMETLKATAATAMAIAKATNNINDSNTQNLHTNLRLSNIEQTLKKQEQKTNEVVNTLNTNKRKYTPKNYSGSQTKEPLASSMKQALQTTQTKKKNPLIDLTMDEEDATQHFIQNKRN
jgi:uncharacterized protein YqgV (UPF0045/DUF77 family)